MRKIALIIGLLVAGTIVLAQDKREELREKREIKIEEYRERLELSDAQISDLKKLRVDAKPQLDEIRNDTSKSRSDKMRALAAIMEKQEKEVAEILNDEQLTELEAIKKEVRENQEVRREKRKERRGDGR
ncbi:hypothetical protein [Ekhidna sp.]|uniref:hypothetical protein n=1 Tax=Ekhidna sp. TaxID=2608089 RepID=UPI0032EFAB61